MTDEERDDAEALGLPEEMVADWEEAEEDEREEELEDVCELLPENENVLRVFDACEFDSGFAGMNGVLVHTGISGREVFSNCVLLRIRSREWPWIREGVRIMASIIVPALNREAADRGG